MVRTLLAGVLFATATFAAPVPKDFIKPKPVLDGKWKVTAYKSNGQTITNSSILQQTWQFAGEELTVTRTGANVNPQLKPTKLKVKTNPKPSPAEIDYTMASGGTRPGLYALDGDTLTICLTVSTTTGKRPTTLDGGTGTLRYVFQRVKDK